MSTLAVFLLFVGVPLGIRAVLWLYSRATDRRIQAEVATAIGHPERDTAFEFPNPPATPTDVPGWDRYWELHLQNGGRYLAFSDMLALHYDPAPLLAARGVQTVLCVGNGLSSEPARLAAHGLEVRVLDLSPLATRASADRWNRTQATAGSVTFVCGDLFDPSSCPGPFDAVIERRTLQLYRPAEQALGLERLTARLAPRGVFVSHVHLGGWQPGQATEHYAQAWLNAHGFSSDVSADRMYRLTLMTG